MADSGFRFLDPPTPEEEVTRVLKVLADGTYTPETLEGMAIDLKEDASSRNQKTDAGQGDRCVEVSSSTLLQGRFADAAADPSFLESTTRIDAVSERALARLCELAAGADRSKSNLSTIDVVSRLGLRYGDTEYLNKAGEILLTTRTQPAIDYTYRDVRGGPSRVRMDQPGRSLLEEIDAVEAEAARHNPAVEIQTGFVIREVRHIPERTLREVILNGVCHRDWNDPELSAASAWWNRREWASTGCSPTSFASALASPSSKSCADQQCGLCFQVGRQTVLGCGSLTESNPLRGLTMPTSPSPFGWLQIQTSLM